MAGSPKVSNTNWVLLRGWTRESRHWRSFPQLLAQATQGEVVTLDLPGAGSECSRASPTTIRAIMEDARRRFKQDHSSGCFVVVGISMGGMVALDWVTRYPEDLGGIVLINSSLSGLSKPWERLNFKNLPELLRLLRLKKKLEFETGVLKLTSSLPLESQTPIAAEFTQIAESAPVQKMNFIRQLLAAMKFSPDHWPKHPAFVISSKEDQLVNPICSVKLAAWMKAPTSVHPTAGHDLPLDDPKWLSAEIARWWAHI